MSNDSAAQLPWVFFTVVGWFGLRGGGAGWGAGAFKM